METIRKKTTSDYKVAIIGMKTVDQTTVDVELSAEEALVLADQLRENAMTIMDEVYNMPIVTQIVKALIDCGKISRLEYSNISYSEETGMTLYNIKAIFTDGKSRHYKYECKFFENKEMLIMQLDYVKNIPIIFRDKSLPPHVKSYDGMTGYNLMNAVKQSDLKNASSSLMDTVRGARPITTVNINADKEGVE